MRRSLLDSRIVRSRFPEKRYLILDRGTKYCQAFRDFVKREDNSCSASLRPKPRSRASQETLSSCAVRSNVGDRLFLAASGRGALANALINLADGTRPLCI